MTEYDLRTSTLNDWEPWQLKYYWYPKRIFVKHVTPKGGEVICSKWIWFKHVYERRRVIVYYPKTTYELEYAEDLFELIKHN